MSQITEDDLNLRATREDASSVDLQDDYIGVQSANSKQSFKSILAPANRKRLIMYVFMALVLLFAIMYTFFSVSEDDAARSQIGGGSTDRVRMPAAGSQDEDSWMVQQTRQEYNEQVLPEVQRDNPYAHPLLDTSPDNSEDLEFDNPFVEEVNTGAPRTLSEAVVPDAARETEGQDRGARRNSHAGIQSTDIDSLIEGLVAAEGERQPAAMRVSWSYAPTQAEQAPSSAAVGGGVDGADQGQLVADADEQTSLCPRPLVRAGQMYMATADIALNSDVGGPVSFTVRNGPIRGGQLMGNFERVDKWVRVNLNRVVLPQETVPLSAIALDMDTTLNAVEGHLDRHIMYRYGWWGFGTTLRAIGKAAESNADSDIYISDGVAVQSTTKDSSREIKIALGELGQELGDVMRERINRPITVSLNVGDEVGIFMLDDVCSTAGSRRG